jgi:EF hand
MMVPSRWPAVAFGLFVAVAGGCSDRTVRVPSMDPTGAANRALREYDADKDGALAGAELAKCPGLKDGLARIDTNGDGRITADELAARLRQYEADKAGLLYLNAAVTLDGKPLADAVITLVPEKFMASGVKPAKGVTGASGSCEFQIEGKEYPGIHPGIFRIEVSKKDARGEETIPAKYNTQTTLGIEAGKGNPHLFQGLMLPLSSR